MANFKHTARRDTQQNNTAGTRNTTGSTVQSQAQSQAQPQTKNATRQTSNNSQGVSYKHSAPSSQASQSASQPTQQKQQKSSQRSVQQTQTQQKAQRQYGQRSNVKTSAPTIQATVQNAPTVQQSASQQTRNPNTAQGRRNIESNKPTEQKPQERTRWDTIKTIVETAARNNKITAPFMQVADAVERKSTPEARYSVKADTGKNKQDENKSFTRKVTETASDIIRSIPEAIANNRENRSIQFGLSDAEQERIARERGASDEDIALAKQAFAENINYINRNAQHGHTYEKMVENQMRTAGGLPMDSWLRFLPDDDGNIVDRSLNSARAGVLMHGQGLTGLQANIGNRLGANNYAQDRLDDYRYQQLLTQQALSGDNQGAYDRIFANSVSNLLTGLETTALGQLGGMSLGTHALENVGLGNMSLNAFGNAYGNVMTGGMGEQYAGDVDAARRYAYASALNELGQEKMFDALGLISGGKITENTIPGANVFGLGSFITEAAEEGMGALADPFTEAALEGNVFSPEYWNRVGEIYGEQGLTGTMQNVRDSAIEGGLGGVVGGVMSNPVQSARQIGSDLNTLARYGDERELLRRYNKASEEYKLALEQGTELQKQATKLQRDAIRDEINTKLYEGGSLRSSMGFVKKNAQELNRRAIEHDAESLGLSKADTETLIAGTNKEGTPLYFIDDSFLGENADTPNRNDAVQITEEESGRFNKQKIQINPAQSDPITRVFFHEATHATEGTNEYFKLIKSLDKLEQMGVISDGGNYWGTEHYARLVEDLVTKHPDSIKEIIKTNPSMTKYLYNQIKAGLRGDKESMEANRAIRRLGEAINGAKQQTFTLEFDPLGLGKDWDDYTPEEKKSLPRPKDSSSYPWVGGRPKIRTERRKTDGDIKSANRIINSQDFQNSGLTESDMEVFSDAVADVMGDDLTPITKDVFDKVAKTNEKAKALGFDAFKQVMDEYDGRSDEYAEENMTEEEKEINLTRQYEEPGDYLSAKGIAPADAKRLGDNLKKKGDYSPYNYERGWKSLRSKGFSESEAKAFLDNFKDEYNKRFPQGLEAAQARAEAESQRTQEPEQKKSKKSESASINRMAAEDAREQRNRDKNAKPKFIFDKNGRVINAETRKPVENVKRTSLNEQSTEQAPVETEQKEATPRKTESQIYEETFNPTTKETKAETKKNEKVEEKKTEEVKTEENKVEERKEETSKEETTVEPTATEQRTEPETISEERQRDLDTLAYFRNQEPENANLPRGMERVQRKADTETETKTTERVQTKSRIGKNDTEVASMDAHEMMRYFHNEDWSASDEFYEKNKADRDRIEGEVDTLVKEVEESKATPREEGNVENTLAALLYRAGCSLETANRFAKEVEETGKAPGKRDVQREIFNSHRTFADRQSADEFVERVVKAYKNMPSETRVENGQEVVRKTGTEMTGAEFNRMSAEPATGEGYTLDMDTTGATETTRVKADKVRKRDAIYERAEEKVKQVNEASKEIRGKEFTSKEQENIRGAETLAEETREEQIKQTQAHTDEYVNKQAEAEQQTSQQTEQTESGAQAQSQNTQQNQQSTNNQQSNQQDAGQQQQDRMRDKANERRTRPEDTSIHATMEKLRKNKNVDPSITARIDESLTRKAVVHDAEVRKDADEWLKQGGLKNAISYAEGILQQNNPAVTEEELVYLEKAFEESNKLSQDIRAQIEKLEKANRPEDAEALSILRDEQKRATDNATTVVEAMANAASEAGRVLRVMRFLQQSPVTATNYIQRTIDNLNKVYAKELGKNKLTLDQSLIDEYVNAKDDKARDAAMEKIEYQIADQLPRRAGDMVKQWRMTCMLTNPRTHMRNIISNTATYGLFRLNDQTQAAIEWAIMKNEGLQKALGYKESDRKAVLGAVGKEYKAVAEWLDTIHEYSKERNGNGKFSEYDARLAAGAFSNKNAFGRLLNGVNAFNNKMLGWEDKIFVEGRARISMAQMLQAQGYTVERNGDGFTIKDKNGKVISDKVLKGMEKAALHDAQEATYHDFNQMAKLLNNAKKKMGKAGVALDIVVPFVKTPANILNLSLQYSPVGLMYHATADLGKVRSGEMSASTYVTRVSRGVTGTALFLIGAALANAGIISKPEDDDEDGRTSYYQSNIFGRQPLALRLGDKYYSLDWAMPTAAPFMMGASFAGTLGRYGKNLFDLDELPENMSGIIRDTVDMMNPVLEASYLSSLNDMLTSFVQGSNYGGEIFGAGFAGGMERMGESIAENFVGQLSPTFGGAINRTIDPVKRTTSANTSWERMVNRTLMNIPGMSRYLQPAIDQKGQELENFDFGIGWAGRAIYNTLVPSTITVDTHDDFDSALMDVGAVALPRNQTGTGGLKGQIYYDLEKMGLDIGDITSEEYTQIKKTYYGNYRQYAEDYNELAEYNNLGTHARDDVYKKLEQLALAEAKEVYYKRVGDVSELYKDEQIAALELKRLGVSPAQFYLMKDCGLTGNRRALYVASELERLGVMDEVEQAILNQKCFPSAFGLTDSILVKTPDEREAAREKYLNEDGETLESVVAAYRAMSNEEYEKKKKEDSEETVQESWESLFSKYDKKYGTHYADAFAELNGKENTGTGSKGKGTKGSKGSSGGRKKSSTKTTKTKTTSTKNYTPRGRSGRRSSGGGGSSVDADTLELFERFMKYANGALKTPSKSKSDIKASVSTSSEAALWDSIVNSSKSNVEKLKRELGLK